MALNITCHVCKSPSFTNFEEFAKLGQATSDCKPWSKSGNLGVCNDCGIVQKHTTDSWRAETRQIYDEYDLYHQSPNNQEQPIFNSVTGKSMPRTVAVLEYANTTIALDKFTKIIDIGCGVGNTLKSIGKMLPNANLYGFEPNAHKKQALEQIPNVRSIYTDVAEFNTAKFDLITMIHVLEHIEDPIPVIESFKNILNSDNSYLVIAVPDYVNNPFDLIIADHASHFSVETLSALIKRSGFEVVAISNTAINKEIIAICKVDNAPATAEYKCEPNVAYVKKQLAWMLQTAEEAKQISAQQRPFGIFGTSIAANWLYGMIADKVDYFVDEDLDRVDRTYHAKPVYHSTTIPNASHTYLCLQPNVVQKVLARIEGSEFTLYPTPSF